MTNVKGMTLKQFNDTIKDMRTVYNFKDDETRLISLMDLRSDSLRSVEIITQDEATGVTVVLKKGVELDVAY